MTTNYRTPPDRINNGQNLGDLVADLSARASLLARQEVQLAKAEMTEKAAAAKRDLTLIVTGAVLAHVALFVLAAALVLGLSLIMQAWLAALIVGLVLAFVGIIMAVAGIKAIRNIDPLPEQTMQSIREDKEWLTQQIS